MANKTLRLAAIAAALTLITAGHFALDTARHGQHVVHVALGAAYLLPITAAAVWFGLRGAIGASLLVAAVSVPHILTDWRNNEMENVNQYSMLGVSAFAGITAGVLVELQERERRRKLAAERRALRSALVTGIASLSAALAARDGYTQAHSQHVSKLAVAIAARAGYSGERLEVIRLAGLVHDVGKIGIRDDVLFKPAKLTPDEREAMELHPALAAEILRAIPESERLAEIVLSHHEAIDGTGYPRGVRAGQFPDEARILAVADVFSALTEARPYKDGMQVEGALEIMRGMAGGQLDPVYFKMLEELVAEGGTTASTALLNSVLES